MNRQAVLICRGTTFQRALIFNEKPFDVHMVGIHEDGCVSLHIPARRADTLIEIKAFLEAEEGRDLTWDEVVNWIIDRKVERVIEREGL